MRAARAGLLVLLLAGCASRGLVSDRMYFGRDIRGTATVSEAEWTQFVNDVVAPAFGSGGWTAFRAHGLWRDNALQLTVEESFVLERVHRAGAREDSVMHAIARAYITRFQQQAVLRVRTPARMELIEAR